MSATGRWRPELHLDAMILREEWAHEARSWIIISQGTCECIHVEKAGFTCFAAEDLLKKSYDASGVQAVLMRYVK